MIGEITNIGVYLDRFSNSVGTICFNELNNFNKE